MTGVLVMTGFRTLCKRNLGTLEEIHKREEAIAALEAELARLRDQVNLAPRDLNALKAAMLERMGKSRELIHADIPLARQALQKLLSGPIKCIPVVRDGKKGLCDTRRNGGWRFVPSR